MDKIIFYTIMLGIFIWYTLYIRKKFGKLPSYSNSYYKLPPGKKWMFVLWAAGLATPMIYLTYGSWFGFLGGLGLYIVATSPIYKERLIKYVHFFGAGLSFIGSYGWMYQNEVLVLSSFSLLIIIMLLVFHGKDKSIMYDIEFVAFVTSLIAIFYVVILPLLKKLI